MSGAEAFLASMEAEMGGVPCNFGAFKPMPVFVGQDVTDTVSMFSKQIRTGSGLAQQHDKVIATQVGILRFEQPNIYWVDHYDNRYRPRMDDNVIGVITEAFAESYRVDLKSTGEAQLPALAFDGASKRNRPNLKIGDLIYARVARVHRDMDPELTCTVGDNGPKKDWVTGQSIYGELKGGHVFECSTSLADRLLDPECPVLLAISKYIAFEIAVGANGFVWVNAEKPLEIILIINAIRKSDFLKPSEIPGMVSDLVKTTKAAAEQGQE